MPARITRVFIDTNVWFSSLYGSNNCQTIIDAHRHGMFTAIISARVLDELVKNVENKLSEHLPKLQALLVSCPPEIVPNPMDIPEQYLSIVSLKDLPIFVSAVLAGADYFITGNIKDFKRNRKKKVGNITILTPKEAVQVFGLSYGVTPARLPST